MPQWWSNQTLFAEHQKNKHGSRSLASYCPQKRLWSLSRALDHNLRKWLIRTAHGNFRRSRIESNYRRYSWGLKNHFWMSSQSAPNTYKKLCSQNLQGWSHKFIKSQILLYRRINDLTSSTRSLTATKKSVQLKRIWLSLTKTQHFRSQATQT